METKLDFQEMNSEGFVAKFPEMPSGIQPGHLYGCIDSNGTVIPDLDLSKCRLVPSDENRISRLNWK